MESAPMQQAALKQLSAVPGVVGSLVFGREGGVAAAEFPAVFDVNGLEQLAGQLSGDAYFQDWLAGEQASLDLRYADGHVIVRALDGAWLLVLCTLEANSQLLSMSLTQVIRRLRQPAGASPGRVTGEFPMAVPPPPVERLRAIATAELGTHASQALEILAAAGPTTKELLKAVGEVEKLTRMFIDKRKAEEIGRRMRDVIGS